jgi:SAM-dependent methyltransferase
MPDNSSPTFWDEQYDSGRVSWDLGGPTPVFQGLLLSGRFPPGRLIVLGAGQGHDARLFARFGFTVTAVDFSPQAVRTMQVMADSAAPLEILQEDIFTLPADLDGAFDYILEYVCFCAIDPADREKYFDAVARLLAPGGTYIALAFPIGQYSGGPPFAVTPEAMIAPLELRGFELVRREVPPNSVRGRSGREELLILTKPV